jgi:hypothetical protein
VIAFGAAMDDPEAYRRYAMPGIERTREPDSEVYAFAATGPVCRSYNLVLDIAARRDDLEALVLVQQDKSIAWWEGSVSAAPAVHSYNEHGSGELPAFAWLDAAPAPAEVDTLDGSLLVLAPWAVKNLRFDEALRLSYGFDLDFCLRVREAGRKVMTADLRTIRHRPLEIVRENEHKAWIEAHIAMAEKWDGRLAGAGAHDGDWKRHARRSEAEREAAKTVAYSRASDLDAQIAPLERALAEVTDSAAWRLTKPLREFNLWRAGRRERRS